MHRILAGDVGGTHTRLALLEVASASSIHVLAQDRFLSSDYSDVRCCVTDFMTKHALSEEAIEAIAFAVAGPIESGRVAFTNLPWVLEEARWKAWFPGRPVLLLNDFEALAHGIPTLNDSDLYVLQKAPVRPKAPAALIGAGTGLGVALMLPSSKGFQVFPTEGGHVDFAPTDEVQVALLRYLRRSLRRVSDERFLSGQGLLAIYKFACQHPLFEASPSDALRHAMHTQSDLPAVISRFAFEEKDPLALRAMDIFVRIYGSVCGNLALTALPYAGLYIGGGIAPKMLPALSDGRFMDAFSHKGRMSGLLKNIPISVILRDDTALRGAALRAYQAF